MTNTVAISIFDDLGFYKSPQKDLNLDIVYQTVNDPLATLIQSLGKDSNTWYDRTYVFSEVKEILKNKSEFKIEPFAREWSEQIKSYYRNKYFLNRFKNREVSNFQQTVEDIISTENSIKEHQFPPLFKLPYFYLEDLAVEEIMKEYKSVSDRKNKIEDDFTFVTKVKRFGKSNDRYIRFLLQNSKKQLLSIALAETNTSFPLWNYLYENTTSINFTGTVNIDKFKGTEFFFYNIISSAYSIKINKT